MTMTTGRHPVVIIKAPLASAVISGPAPERLRVSTKHYRPSGKPKYSCTFRILSDAIMERPDIGASAKLVLMALQAFGRNGKKCFPSNEAIGKKCGLSEATVKRALRELVSAKLLFIATNDPDTPKGRRFDRHWLADPALHPSQIVPGDLAGHSDPKREAQNDLRPIGSFCTHPLEGQNDPIENSSERTNRMSSTMTKTESSSSSSDDPLSQEGKGSQESDAERDARVKAEQDVVATFPGTSAEKVKMAVAKFGPDVVAYGIKRFHAVGGGKDWGWFYGLCKNVKAEGGPPGEPIKILPSQTHSMTYHTAATRPSRSSKRDELLDSFEEAREQRRLENEAAQAKEVAESATSLAAKHGQIPCYGPEARLTAAQRNQAKLDRQRQAIAARRNATEKPNIEG